MQREKILEMAQSVSGKGKQEVLLKNCGFYFWMQKRVSIGGIYPCSLSWWRTGHPPEDTALTSASIQLLAEVILLSWAHIFSSLMQFGSLQERDDCLT